MISDKFLESSKILQEGVILIPQSYKIVEKEETSVLIKTLDECRTIYKAYSVMSIPSVNDWEENTTMIQMMNLQIFKKLERMYRYYHRHYGLLFDSDRTQKAIEDNIADICEYVRSWEE